jgi:hypothetical protein
MLNLLTRRLAVIDLSGLTSLPTLLIEVNSALAGEKVRLAVNAPHNVVKES